MKRRGEDAAYEAGSEVKPAALSTDGAVVVSATGKVSDTLNSKMPMKSGGEKSSGELQLLITALEPRTKADFSYKVLEGLKNALESKPSMDEDRAPQPLAHILEDPSSYEFVLIKQDFDTVIRTVEDLYKRVACGCVHVHLARPSEGSEDCGAFMLEKTAVNFIDINHNGYSTSVPVRLTDSAEEEDEPSALLADELDDLIANLEPYGHEDGVGVSEEAVGDLDNLVYYVSLVRSSAVEGDVRYGGAHAWQYPLMVRLPPPDCFNIQEQVHFCRTLLPDYLERCGTAEALACSGESRDENFTQVYLCDQAGAAMSSSAMSTAGGFNVEVIQSILEMGFDRSQAESALHAIWPSSSVELALNWLLEGGGSSTPETIAPFWPPTGDEQKPPAAPSHPPPSTMPRLTAAVDTRPGAAYGSDCGLKMPVGGLSRERPGLLKSDRVTINRRWDSQAMADSHTHAPPPPPPPSSPSLTCSSVPQSSSMSTSTSSWFPLASSSSFTSSASASASRSLPVNYSPNNDGMINTVPDVKPAAAVKPASRSMLKRAEPEGGLGGVLGARTPLPFLPPPPFSEDRRDPRPPKKIARADHADLKRPSLDDFHVPFLKPPSSDMRPGAFSDDRPLKKLASTDLKKTGARGHHHSRTCISALASPASSSPSSSSAASSAAPAGPSSSSSSSSASLSSTTTVTITSLSSPASLSGVAASSPAPATAATTPATATAAATTSTAPSPSPSSSPPSPSPSSSSSSYSSSIPGTVNTLFPPLPPPPPIVLKVDPVRLVKVGAITEKAKGALKENEGGVAARLQTGGGGMDN